jgi:hydrogenase maturation protease
MMWEVIALRSSVKTTTEILILGVGNILLKDEGIGPFVIKELEKEKLPPRVALLDAGTQILDTMLSQDRVEKLIIIDAVKAGGVPGTVYKFRPEDIERDTEVAISLHQATVLEALKILEIQDLLPKEVVIVGVEPNTIEWGLEPSDELKAKIPELIRLLKKEMKNARN